MRKNRTRTALQAAGVVFVALAYLLASGSDREQLARENSHWCAMVAEGAWYASRDEFARRCQP